MAQQTAVRRLIDYITERGFDLEYEMEMSFLDMEKEQIQTAYLNGVMHPLEMEATKQAEEYHNEIYKK